jgi:phage terminase large subunit-like protein
MKRLDPVTKYATDVVGGRIVAGRWVRLACQRHLRDLELAREKGLDWRPDEAQRVIDFYAEILCLPEETSSEENAPDAMPADGSPFVLSPHQQFINGSLMGWYTRAGYRRFRDAYDEEAKGSGKTPNGAGMMLYLLVGDGERGAQVFFAATSRDQAKLAHADAEKMVMASPHLREVLQITINNIAMPSTRSFLRAISSEKRGLDGKRVHGALLDEEHEQPTDVVVSKMRRGTKGRRNALVLRTTNSGFDRTSICWHDHEYSTKVLEGTIVDESWFAFICGLDPCERCLADGKQFPTEGCPDCDDWRTEGPHWLKACPNLGRSVSWQYYRDLVRQAKNRPDAVSDLLRFNFCQWTQQQTRAIVMAQWHACPKIPPVDELADVSPMGGLDLGQSDDLSAWARAWYLADGRVGVRMRFWLPRAAVAKYPGRPYDEWARAGVLTVTDGNTTDFDVVEATIADDCATDGVQEVAYDNRFAEQLAQHLTGHGVVMVNTGQGFQLNEALKWLLDLIVNGKLCHDDPILSWMASNFVVKHGTKGEIRPAKEHAADKIDGIVALAMALDRLIRQPRPQPAEDPELVTA